MQAFIFFLFALLIGLAYPSDAYAYTGPGLGLGTLGVILGVLLSAVLAVFGVAWYPLKRLLTKMGILQKKKLPQSSAQTAGPADND